MGSIGKCKICGETVQYSPDDVASLGLHVVNKHPNIDIVHFTLLYNDEPCTCSCNCARRGCQSYKSRAFKTTIESWRNAQVAQQCGKCGKTSVPLIRRQRHKLSKSPFGAFILLGLWPLCFLPFILGGSDLMYLYCRECGNYLGVYDRRHAIKHPICRLTDAEGRAQICGCCE